MWFIYTLTKTGSDMILKIATHSDYRLPTRQVETPDIKLEWLVTENPFDYKPNYVIDRNGIVWEIKPFTGEFPL